MKKRRRVLALFMSIFLRNRSLSDAMWFYGKKHKIGKGNQYLTENRLTWNEMCCASDNHNHMCHTCAKEKAVENTCDQDLSPRGRKLKLWVYFIGFVQHNFYQCAKDFLNSRTQLSGYWKNINFLRYCTKFHIFTKNRNFSSIFTTF